MFNFKERNRKREKRWKEIGSCVVCGEPCKPYRMCFTHRLHYAKLHKKYYLNGTSGRKNDTRTVNGKRKEITQI